MRGGGGGEFIGGRERVHWRGRKGRVHWGGVRGGGEKGSLLVNRGGGEGGWWLNG